MTLWLAAQPGDDARDRQVHVFALTALRAARAALDAIADTGGEYGEVIVAIVPRCGRVFDVAVVEETSQGMPCPGCLFTTPTPAALEGGGG